MPPIDRSDPVILGHVLAEHHDLFLRMHTIAESFADARPPTADRTAATLESLAGLRAHLATHFEQEERGGFMEESIARIPRLAAAASAVLRQHPELLAELDALIGGLRRGDISDKAWARAGRDFAHFAASMKAHERSENAVVQEGYNEDLGLLD